MTGCQQDVYSIASAFCGFFIEHEDAQQFRALRHRFFVTIARIDVT